MVGPSMDNCSEVWEKRILGWNQRQLRSRHCQADEAARQGMAPAPRGAYLRAAEYFRQAFFSAATTWTGATFAARVSGWQDSLPSS
jgi:hypothetical protein